MAFPLIPAIGLVLSAYGQYKAGKQAKKANAAAGQTAYPGMTELGGAYSKYLLKKLNEDVTQSKSYKLGSLALEEGIGKIAERQREQLGRNAVGGGYRDSGEFYRMLHDIDTGEIESFGTGLRDLILALEDERTSEILPFLSGGSQEAQNRAATSASIFGAKQSGVNQLISSGAGLLGDYWRAGAGN